MERNMIAHCQSGNSDKIYMSCVRENSDGTYSALAKWGRRGKTLQQTFKLTSVSLAQAQAEQEKVFNQKLKAGYVNIDDVNYGGPVTTLTVQDDMEAGDGAPTPRKPRNIRPKENQKKAPAPKAPPKEGVAVCLNHSGIEDKFDEGIEYVFEAHDDPTMIWMFDKEGERQECFSERFEVVDED
jgi:predicted DNA-binding WGR domain protein